MPRRAGLRLAPTPVLVLKVKGFPASHASSPQARLPRRLIAGAPSTRKHGFTAAGFPNRPPRDEFPKRTHQRAPNQRKQNRYTSLNEPNGAGLRVRAASW